MKLRFAAVALLLSTTSVFAADLAPAPVEPIAPIAYAPFDWTGFYVGVNVGGAWNDSKWSGFAAPSFNTNGSGVIYGGQIGYNYQINQFVLGLEGDFNGSSVDKKNQCSNVAGSVCRTEQNWLGSIRARAGYAFDRLLIYGTGGVAFTDYDFSQTAALPQSWGSGSRTGWTAGLGVEYAITDHITAGVEWKYYDFGRKTGSGGVAPAAVRFNETENTVIAKLNYKF